MTRRVGLAVVLALPLLASEAHAQAADVHLDGEFLAGPAPLTLAGVEALVGQSLGSVEHAPLVCAARRPDGSTACRVARRYGAYVIDAPAPLTAKVRLRQLTLTVREQTITAVTFETSPDNFHAVTHLLTARLGAPVRSQSARVRLSREVQPRVTMAWRASSVQVSLTDPTPYQTLSVRISSASPAPEEANGV